MGGGDRRGQKAPPNAPPPLLTKLIPQVQISSTPHPNPCWEKCLMAKWPQRQTKHSECSQAPQTAGTEGPSLL